MMSVPVKIPSRPGIRLSWIIGAVLVIIVGAFAANYFRSKTRTSDDDTSGQTPSAPATSANSSSVNRAEGVNASSASSALQDEKIPEGNLLRGLSGEYKGRIEFSEADISGEATLTISGERFIVRPARGRELSGHLAAKNMGEYVDLRVTFDERSGRVIGSPMPSRNIVNVSYNPAQLPALSLRATLPGNGEGWLIRNAPDEKHGVMFTSTNCPPFPYCKPVRRCRPCEP